MTDDIAVWLTAIWDEDERAARAHKDAADGWLEPPPRFGPSHGYVGAPVRPTFDQITVRIAADRQILATYLAFRDAPERMTDVRADSWWRALDEVVRLLALPHAARPGYNENWRPARLP